MSSLQDVRHNIESLLSRLASLKCVWVNHGSYIIQSNQAYQLESIDTTFIQSFGRANLYSVPEITCSKSLHHLVLNRGLVVLHHLWISLRRLDQWARECRYHIGISCARLQDRDLLCNVADQDYWHKSPAEPHKTSIFLYQVLREWLRRIAW